MTESFDRVKAALSDRTSDKLARSKWGRISVAPGVAARDFDRARCRLGAEVESSSHRLLLPQHLHRVHTRDTRGWKQRSSKANNTQEHHDSSQYRRGPRLNSEDVSCNKTRAHECTDATDSHPYQARRLQRPLLAGVFFR